MVHMQPTADAISDDARYRAAIKELIVDWDRRQWNGRRVEPDCMEQFLMVTGFASQGYEQARAYLSALQIVPETAVIPLARAVFEEAITAQWLALVPDGWKAIAQEYGRQQRLLAKDLRTIEMPGYDAIADRLDASVQHHPDRLTNAHTAQGRHFGERCKDLTTKDAYIHFRMLSSEAHPTVAVPGKWIQGPLEQEGPARVVKPELGTDGYWPDLMVTSLVLLAGAQTALDGDEERKQFLRRVAEENGTMTEMRLSQVYYERMENQ